MVGKIRNVWYTYIVTIRVRMRCLNMGKPLKHIDEHLDRILDMDDLKAVGGTENDILAMNPDTEVPICLICRHKMKNHDRRERRLLDIVRNDNGELKVITLRYHYYRYRCVNKECINYGRFEKKDVKFAAPQAETTYRYEERIVRLAMYLSYRQIEKKLLNEVTKSTISNMIIRWVQMKDLERGVIYSPRIVGFFTNKLGKRKYTIVVDAEDEDMHILDVLPNINATAVAEYMSSFNKENTECVLIDCEDIVVTSAQDYFGKAEIMVSVDAILESAKQEFREALSIEAKQVYTSDKRDMLVNPSTLSKGRSDRIEKILADREHLNKFHAHIASLIRILSKDDWDAVEIYEWNQNIKMDLKDDLFITSEYIDLYWNEILKYYMRRNEVTGDLYQKIKELNSRIYKFGRYSSFTDDVFRARILYTSEADITEEKNMEKWRGVSIDNVMNAINELINEMEEFRRGN